MARAGKRKCKRCKLCFYRGKGHSDVICPDCIMHCRRCGAEHLIEMNRLCDYCQKIQRGYSATEKARDNRLINTYGITLDEYEEMLEWQGGKCWICRKKPTNTRLHIDHLHSKGEKKRNPREKRGRVRGLLCWQCNSSIAKFKDDITKLKKAANYLEVWPAQAILKEENK